MTGSPKMLCRRPGNSNTSQTLQFWTSTHILINGTLIEPHQICLHRLLNNKEANHILNMLETISNTKLPTDPSPKYLGVIVDRSLTNILKLRPKN